MTDKMHLNVFLMPHGHHDASWRHPESDPEGALGLSHYIELARTAERGKLDSLFLADVLALPGNVAFNAHVQFEPTTLLAALAASTSHIGLIGTASTSYHEPFHLSRVLASLDHLSGGRSGWNIVTSVGEDEAQNFSREHRANHATRYQRAAEFVEVATQLWDSWDDDAFIADKATGRYADRSRISPIDHTGDHFQVRGPLNVTRPIQGWPVLVQAGSSETGREFAARFAEAVFTAQDNVDDARLFYQDVKAQLAAFGRTPDEMVILPGICPIIGATEAEAQEKEAALRALVNPEAGLTWIKWMFDVDLSGCDLDGPVPELTAGTDGNKSRFDLIAKAARRDGLTVRNLLERFAAGRGHRMVTGTPSQVADELELWFRSGAADGFNIMPAVMATGLSEFVDGVVPELQRRGLFRTEYSGTTLRDHFGLARKAPGRARS